MKESQIWKGIVDFNLALLLLEGFALICVHDTLTKHIYRGSLLWSHSWDDGCSPAPQIWGVHFRDSLWIQQTFCFPLESGFWGRGWWKERNSFNFGPRAEVGMVLTQSLKMQTPSCIDPGKADLVCMQRFYENAAILSHLQGTCSLAGWASISPFNW